MSNQTQCITASTIDDVPLELLAREFATPFYAYSATQLRHTVARFRKAAEGLPLNIHYAVKANSNGHILRLLKEEGCGADIVSGGELFRALKAGFSPRSLVFSGVGKSRQEIQAALEASINWIHVESVDELSLIQSVADELNLKPKVSLRLNPDQDAATHQHISTGRRDHKFGLSPEELEFIHSHLDAWPRIHIEGLSCHIGSQILDMAPLKTTWSWLKSVADNWHSSWPRGISLLDLGGGLGIRYTDEIPVTIEDYMAGIREIFQNSPYQLAIEPGRSLVGPAGILVTKVLAIKRRIQRNLVVVDAGMNDLLRPALYGAKHPIFPVGSSSTVPHTDISTETWSPFDIVGPVCESSDVFRREILLPKDVQVGDLLTIGQCGAYGFSMSSSYNSRPRPPEILVDGGRFSLIRRRETYEDLISHELPEEPPHV